MSSVGKIAIAAGAVLATVGAVKMFTGAVKSAADFQTSLNVLQATSHATDGEMKKVSATAMRLGSDIKLPAVSATDAANAMLELAKGGFSAGQSMDAVRGVLLLSTAAEIDGATAATMVADSLHAFGMKASQATVIVDDFAGAANVSTASMGDVGLALQQSGQAFHQLGIPIGDATTAIAAMANAGIKGSDAGTSLKTMLQRLVPQTTQAKNAFKDMNIDVFDQNGKFIGLQQTIAQFQPKLAAMTQEQRAHALQVIFGSDASRAANVILGMSAKQYDALRDKVTKAGSAQRLADARTKGFNGAMQALRSTLETLQLRIGLALLPRLTQLAGWLSRLAGAKNIRVAISIVWEGLKSLAADVSKAVGDALFGSSHIVRIGGRTNVVEVDPGLVAAIGDAIQRAIEGADWTKIGASLAKKLGDATKGGASQADTQGGADAYVAKLMSSLDKTQQKIAYSFGQVVGGALGQGLNMAATDPAGFAVAAGRIAAAVILQLTTPIRLSAQLVAGAITSTISTAFGSALPNARLSAGTLSTAIVMVITEIPKKLGQLGAQLVGVIVGALRTVASQSATEANRVAVNIATSILTAPLRLTAFGGILASAVSGPVSALAESIRGPAGRIATSIANGVKTVGSKLSGLGAAIGGPVQKAVSGVIGSAFTWARAIGFGIADGVISGIGNLASRLGGKLADAAKTAVTLGGILSSGSGPWQFTIHTIGVPMMEGIINGVESLKERLANAAYQTVTTAMSRGGQAVATGTASMTTIFGAWAQNVATKMASVFAKAQAAIEKYKAAATPTEALLAAQQANAAWQTVVQAVQKSEAAWIKLKADNTKAWNDLLETQRKRMAELSKLYVEARDDRVISEHEYNVAATASKDNPLASALVGAQANYDSIKALYDQGLASEAEYIAAWDALQAAHKAAVDATNAEANLAEDATDEQRAEAKRQVKLGNDALELQDLYTHLQTVVAAEAQSATDIKTQRDADAQERLTAQEGYQTAEQTSYQAYLDARQASDDYANTEKARKEREYRDNESQELSTNLNTLFEQWKTHNAKLIEKSKDWGENVIKEYAKGIKAMIKAGGPLADALDDVAAFIAKYLKPGSPTELGPMSDLDKWWTRLAPTLVASLDGKAIKDALTDATTPGLTRRPFASGAAGPQQLSLNDRALIDKLSLLVDEMRRSRMQAGGLTVIATGGADASVYASKR